MMIWLPTLIVSVAAGLCYGCLAADYAATKIEFHDSFIVYLFRGMKYAFLPIVFGIGLQGIIIHILL